MGRSSIHTLSLRCLEDVAARDVHVTIEVFSMHVLIAYLVYDR